MPSQFFHGVAVTEVETPQGTVQLPSSSIIGLVGTAPNAQQVATATLLSGVVGSNTAFTLTAVVPGAAANGISLQIRTPSGANVALSIQVNGVTITVFLATGSTAGTSTTTVAQLIAALNANAAVALLLAATETSSSTGAGLASNLVQTYLSGGINGIALNTPILITAQSQLASFGIGGSIPQALNDIFNQCSPAVVVVVVAQVESDQDSTTITNVIGSVSGSTYTGCKCLLNALTATGSQPRILIAPNFSQNLTVATELLVEANALKAITVCDGPNTTNAAAITYAQNFGDRRMFLVEGGDQYLDPNTGALTTGNASAVVAGLIAANDQNRGFWTSPSNQEILGIVGTARSVSFSFTNPNSDANYLNSYNIATIIRQAGFRLWGNRTMSLDPAYAFLSVGRTADLIEAAIIAAHQWAVDLNIGKAYFQEVIASVQGFLDGLKAQGAILAGSISVDPSLTTVANIAAGKVYFDVAWTPPVPAEQLNFQVNPVSTAGYASLLPTAPTSS